MSTTIAAGKAVIDFIVHAQREGWIDRLKNVMKSRHNVLVVGSTGAGKSLLLDSLTELLPKAIDLMNRTEFIEKNKITISGQLFNFIDTPGDPEKGEIRRDAYRQSVRDGTKIVLNVVSYGYHEHRTATHDDVFTKGGTVKTSYLNVHKSVEIEYLNEWGEMLFNVGSANTLITVATKADIWWNHRIVVRDNYTSHGYGSAVREFCSNHVVKEYAGRIQKFYGSLPLSGEFDDDTRLELRASLLTTLLDAISRPND